MQLITTRFIMFTYFLQTHVTGVQYPFISLYDSMTTPVSVTGEQYPFISHCISMIAKGKLPLVRPEVYSYFLIFFPKFGLITHILQFFRNLCLCRLQCDCEHIFRVPVSQNIFLAETEKQNVQIVHPFWPIFPRSNLF